MGRGAPGCAEETKIFVAQALLPVQARSDDELTEHKRNHIGTRSVKIRAIRVISGKVFSSRRHGMAATRAYSHRNEIMGSILAARRAGM